VRCPSCSSTVTDGRRFCPSCGTPLGATVGAGARVGAVAGTVSSATPDTPAGTARRAPLGEDAPGTATIVLPDAGDDARAAHDPGAYDANDAEEVVAREERTTQVLAPAVEESRRTARAADAGAALGRAGEAVRRHAGRAADRFGAAPVEVRVATIGAAVTVLSFLALPYSGDGAAASVGGRLWWRPIAAVVATVLLATTLRARPRRATDATAAHAGSAVDRLLAALVVATVGATEAGLVGLFSGDTRGVRIGFYGMLAGLVTVLVAAVRAARRRCAA